MIHEDFVTFEQAKVLEELGFDWETDYYYSGYDKELYSRWFPNEFEYNEPQTPAPTMTQAAKWLRDKKHILISIRPNNFINDSGNAEIRFSIDVFWTSNNYLDLLYSESGYEFYEFALEDGIYEALELLNKR